MAKPDWDALDLDDLARLRDKKLRRQLRYQLYAFSPYYRKLIDAAGVKADGFDGTQDLRGIPPTARDRFAEDPDAFVLKPTRALLQRWASGAQLRKIAIDKLFRGPAAADETLKNEYDPVQSLETSGTEGDPLPVRLSRWDLSILGTQGQRALEMAGVGADDRVLNLLDASNTGAFWAAWFGGVTKGLDQNAPGFMEPSNAYRLVISSEPTVLICAIEDLVAILDEGTLPSVKTVLLAPAPIPSGMVSKAVEQLGPDVKVIQSYHFAEARAIWVECAEGAGRPDCGFHLSSDLELIEMISPRTLEHVQPNEPGEVVFTGLEQRGTAFLRYRPGDVALGGLATGRCPYCGRSTDRIVGPIRRVSNLLELHLAGADPIAIDVEQLADVMAHPALHSWQMEVTKADDDPGGSDEVVVLYSPEQGADAGALAVELNESLVSSIGISVTQFVLSDRAKTGVVDLRPVPVDRPTPSGEPSRVRLWRPADQR